MKKILLSTLLLALPLLASAYDIEVANDDVMIYYNFINNRTELEVTYMNEDDFKSYSGDVNIPEEVTYDGNPLKVTSIGDQAFRYCTDLTSVTIPNSVTTIGDHAFYNCKGLTSVTIPNNVTTIGAYAFSGCEGLTSVTIPNGVTTIGESAFSGCEGLTSVTIGNSVTSIGKDAFSFCNSLTSVTIPNSVTTIGEYAFWNCKGLASVTIPNSVTTIGGSAFSICPNLTSVTIPNSVTSIGEGAFNSCTGLTSIKVESGNTVYDSRNDCNAIIEKATNTLIQGCKTTVIPNSVTTIGKQAFYMHRSLTSVTIPNSVTTIGDHAFQYCEGLTSVSIPNSVTTIGERAFYECTSLTSVTIGNSVTSIGWEAFFRCTRLTSVVSKMEEPCGIEAECFSQDVFSNATLYVPEGTTGKYNDTECWNKFSSIKEIEACATPTISYGNKKLAFSCDTEGVEYVSEIKVADAKINHEAEVDLLATYEISVYATKTGFEDSDVATATLVWMSAQIEGGEPIVTPANAPTESVPVLISSRDGMLTVKSGLEGQSVAVYSLDGKALGSARVKGGQAVIATNLPKGTIVVVKVGEQSVKVSL